MNLLDKQFEVEVTSLEGRKHTLSFTGDHALSEIAHATMILPHLANLIAAAEIETSPGAFRVESFTSAAFQTLKDQLSVRLIDEKILFSTGAQVLRQVVELFDTANQWVFERTELSQPSSLEFSKRTFRAQRREELLGKYRVGLAVFLAANEKYGGSNT